MCRIADYQKFLYQQKKKAKELKANQAKVTIKEIRFGPQTDDHDYNFKLKHAENFLKEGSKVKAYVFFRGRSIVFKEQGEILLLRFATDLEELAKVESMPKLDGNPARWSLYGLLPNYLQREGSSLVYMVDRLIGRCGSGGFYLDDYERLLADMAADPKPKILLGVSYALWDLAERYAPKLRDTIVMETGGMKGRREELPKEEFHRILCEAFGVESIHSEYGMAELTSQAYSDGGGRFRTPGWMRVAVRDVNDPFCRLLPDQRGGIDIIDLANRYSCAFIQTQDVGRVSADGSFRIEGRIDRSDIRGCNLLVQ